ncbi:MAG: hypothetical protein HQL65_17365, partial [Magnetococcales bacterium]|nr:hypothetical protein [Magnetococcales bacterium]
PLRSRQNAKKAVRTVGTNNLPEQDPQTTIVLPQPPSRDPRMTASRGHSDPVDHDRVIDHHEYRIIVHHE